MTDNLQVKLQAEHMQTRPRLACKNACFCKQKDMLFAGTKTVIVGKIIRKNQKLLLSQAKVPVFPENPLSRRKQIQLENAGELACILQLKLQATCVLYYLRSRVFCMRRLPRRRR